MLGATIVFFLILYALYIDAKTLQREDKEIYAQTIALVPWFWPLISILFLNLSFLIVVPIYYFFRKQFFQMLVARNTESPTREYRTPHFALITECALIAMLWFFFLNCIFFIYKIIGLFLPFLSGQLLEFVSLGLLSHIVTVALIWFIVRRNHREGFFKFLHFRRAERWFMQGILLPLIVGVIFAGGSYFMSGIRETNVVTPLGGALAGATPFSLLLFLGSAMLIAPLAEEIIYRGYFYSVISKIKGKWFSIIFISVLFAVFHLDQIWGGWFGLAIIFAMGFCITLLRSWSHSIIPSVVAHYSYNILLVLIPILTFYFSNPAYAKYYLKGYKLDVTEKEELLSESIRRKPEFSVAYNDLAWIYAEQDKNFDDAFDLIEEALRLEPENPAYLDTKAEVLYKLGRYDEAVGIEEKLIEQYPDDSFYAKQLEKFKKARNLASP